MFGLRVIFPLFMKTPSKAKRKDTTPIEHEEHVCSVCFDLNDRNLFNLIYLFLDY